MAMGKSGPDIAGLNAALPGETHRKSVAPGSSGRDAGMSAGIASGCAIKDTFSTTAVDQLGKPIHDMGTVPWDKTPPESIGPTVPAGTFGAGQAHTLKNG